MHVDRDWLRRSLYEQLELLAAPADQTLARLPDDYVKADELALDYDNFYQAYVGHRASELSPDAIAALLAIDESFDRMSGPGHAELWTDKAISTDPAWAEIRRQASRALEFHRGSAAD